ncbi:hypothetical protein L226DRAFT_572389 [Lentinus tigrinus ALCF2SS1-7]|uniref:BTB domain-containing protein n=1 Tax=Lentinus tigrinus ALCF2SS1-6 TaxID=1328759 RepID=A0A5C2S707_9APHY|nr:hypothetical protein L227DRAFT_612386 [Lentinus tigrinus ALCF2SS1-6]RPD73316.1 hypothetical protein L226DRAFT_572389 [Lentinus tigrinus ALCF2SS1-7]
MASNSNPSNRPPEPRTAPSPFNKPTTDIILRTSDHVDFYVYSQILIAASPVFEGMFEVPQPPAGQEELKYGRPIVELGEDSGALETLLRIIYPINKPAKRTVKEVEPALRAAMKFEMELAVTVLTADLQAAASTHPMQVWATACRLQLENMAYTAARVLVPVLSSGSWGIVTSSVTSRPLTFEELGDMEGISAGDYYRLVEFHRLNGKVDQGYKFLSSHASELRSLAQALSAASPIQTSFVARPTVFMQKLHTTAEGDSSSTSTLPALQFQEDDTVVAALLRICYHDIVDDLLSGEPPLLLRILAAVEQHGLTESRARFFSCWKEVVGATPLRAYCVAIGAGHSDCAREAARQVVHTRLEGAYVDEMESIPALSYHRLWTYYRSCERLATERLQETLDVLSSPLRPVSTQPVPPRPQVRTVVWGVPARNRGTVQAPTTPARQPEKTWIRRHIRQMLDDAPAGPHGPFSPLQELVVKATQQLGSPDKFWCDQCQPLAEDLIKVDAHFKDLVAAMDAVELQI